MTAISANVAFLDRLLKSEDAAFPRAMRTAVFIALLSNWFELSISNLAHPLFMQLQTAMVAMAALCLTGSLFERYTRIAVALYTIIYIPYVYIAWPIMANHVWLFLWTIPIISLLDRWWENQDYSNYVRITFGVVMLAAAAQKLIAGTYLDGTYISYLSYFGGTTERAFQPLCSRETLNDPCLWHQAIGSFIVAWQIFVGAVLLLGYRSMIFITVEISFLLGAGLYANEFNFQSLNIALMCIAFRIGVSMPLAALCIFLLIADAYLIPEIIRYVS